MFMTPEGEVGRYLEAILRFSQPESLCKDFPGESAGSCEQPICTFGSICNDAFFVRVHKFLGVRNMKRLFGEKVAFWG